MRPTIEVECKQCKDRFLVRVVGRKRGRGEFCSKSCKAKWQDRVNNGVRRER